MLESTFGRVMRDEQGSLAVLDVLQEPLLVLTREGAVTHLNAAANRTFGADLVGRDFTELVSVPGVDAFRKYLRRCLSRTSPLPAAITMARRGADTRYQTWGLRFAAASMEPRVVIRLAPFDQSEFSVLAKKIRELNAEIRDRRRSEALLEEALADNQVLLRELNHRAKNNIQLMIGLFSQARRDAQSDEMKYFLDGAVQRLVALGTTQHLMYQSDRLKSLSTREYLTDLCRAISLSLGPKAQVSFSASDSELSVEVAQPLSLIINELVTNAHKHGAGTGGQRIHVSLHAESGDHVLVVQDNGPGFAAQTGRRRSSGLGLVRGLCRQIGGEIAFENVNGARVTVRFEDRGKERPN